MDWLIGALNINLQKAVISLVFSLNIILIGCGYNYRTTVSDYKDLKTLDEVKARFEYKLRENHVLETNKTLKDFFEREEVRKLCQNRSPKNFNPEQLAYFMKLKELN